MAVRRVRLRGPSEPTPVVFSELDAGVERANSGRDLRLHRAWLARDRADTLLTAVRATATWTAVLLDQAWFGEDRECGFPPELGALRIELEAFTGTRLSYVLLNRYRDGADGVAWHGDRDIPGRYSIFAARPARASSWPISTTAISRSCAGAHSRR